MHIIDLWICVWLWSRNVAFHFLFIWKSYFVLTLMSFYANYYETCGRFLAAFSICFFFRSTWETVTASWCTLQKYSKIVKMYRLLDLIISRSIARKRITNSLENDTISINDKVTGISHSILHNVILAFMLFYASYSQISYWLKRLR